MSSSTKLTKWLLGAAVAGLPGCQQHAIMSSNVRGDEFRPDAEPHAVQNIVAAQSASGARADATLHPVDFDAAQLNSLGQQKLDMMLSAGRGGDGIVVYLDLPASVLNPEVRSSVADYLIAHGVAASQMRLQDGPNPVTVRPAQDALQELVSQDGLPGQQGAQLNSAQAANSAGPVAPASSGH